MILRAHFLVEDRKNIIAKVYFSFLKIKILAETPGISQCYDAQGRSAGKVVADKGGNTVVYNDKDVPIGTGSVRKVNDRSYEVIYYFK